MAKLTCSKYLQNEYNEWCKKTSHMTRNNTGKRRLSFAFFLFLFLYLILPFNHQQVAFAQTVTVSVQNMQFSPQQITVSAGTTITWVNQESTTPHTTTSDSQTGSEHWNSGNLNPGQSFSHTFTAPGTYTYHCTYHSGMTASVIVTANATSTLTPTNTSAANTTSQTASTATPTP